MNCDLNLKSTVCYCNENVTETCIMGINLTRELNTEYTLELGHKIQAGNQPFITL